MASDHDESVTLFYQRLYDGDRAAAAKLWQHFGHRVEGLARKTLAGRNQRMSDADDAAQSAFASFWQRVERGDFPEDANRDDLWRILGVITVCKALKHQERENTAKRGGGRVHGESSVAGLPTEPFLLDQAVQQIPEQEFDLICEELLEQLDPSCRDVVLLKLAGHTNDEISRQIGCSLSTIERKLRLVRRIWDEHSKA